MIIIKVEFGSLSSIFKELLNYIYIYETEIESNFLESLLEIVKKFIITFYFINEKLEMEEDCFEYFYILLKVF